VFVIAEQCLGAALWCLSYISSCHSFFTPVMLVDRRSQQESSGRMAFLRTHSTQGLYLWLTDTIHLNTEWMDKQAILTFIFLLSMSLPLTWHVYFIQSSFFLVLSNQCLLVVNGGHNTFSGEAILNHTSEFVSTVKLEFTTFY
jgi:hypothetical protein